MKQRKNGRQPGELSPLQEMDMYIAQVVRNEMEDFHVEHLSDAQMRELNPIIRNAVYTALYAAEQAAQGSKGAGIWMHFHSRWPDYWEPPELTGDYEKSVALLDRESEFDSLLDILAGDE